MQITRIACVQHRRMHLGQKSAAHLSHWHGPQSAQVKKKTTPQTIEKVATEAAENKQSKSIDDVKNVFGKVVNSVVALSTANASVTKDGQRCEVCGFAYIGGKRCRVWVYTFRLGRDGIAYVANGKALAKRISVEQLTKTQALALIK